MVAALGIGIVVGLLISQRTVTDDQHVVNKEARIRDAIAANFFDPESVRLTELKVVPISAMKAGGPLPGRVDFVCGNVNAKNRLGGYVGTQAFTGMYAERGQDFLESEDDPLEAERFRRDFGIDVNRSSGPVFVSVTMGERGTTKGDVAYRMCADAETELGGQ